MEVGRLYMLLFDLLRYEKLRLRVTSFLLLKNFSYTLAAVFFLPPRALLRASQPPHVCCSLAVWPKDGRKVKE